MDINSILNYAIPILIVLIFCGIFYSNPKIKIAVDTVIKWIIGLFSWGFGKVKDTGEQNYETVYRYG